MVNTILDADGRSVNLAVYGITKTKKNELELPEYEPQIHQALGGLMGHYLRTDVAPGKLNLQIRMRLATKAELMRKRAELQWRLRHCFVTFKKEEGLVYELTQQSGVKIETLSEASVVLTIPFTYEIRSEQSAEIKITELNQTVYIEGAKETDLEFDIVVADEVPAWYEVDILGVRLTNVWPGTRFTISKTMSLSVRAEISRFPTAVGETVIAISGNTADGDLTDLSQVFSSVTLRYRARW